MASAAVRPLVIGKWNVTFGAPAIVRMNGAGHHNYTMTAATPIEISGGSSCRLPIGTVLGTFSGTGPTFTGQIDLFYVSNCMLGAHTALTITLHRNRMVASFAATGSPLTFTRFAHQKR